MKNPAKRGKERLEQQKEIDEKIEKEGKVDRSKMEVRVGEEICEGCEIYVEICPEIFEIQWDVAVAKMEEIPEELEGACLEAAESCPVEAIVIEE